jgi:hypothetical protein
MLVVLAESLATGGRGRGMAAPTHLGGFDYRLASRSAASRFHGVNTADRLPTPTPTRTPTPWRPATHSTSLLSAAEGLSQYLLATALHCTICQSVTAQELRVLKSRGLPCLMPDASLHLH